MEHWEVLGWGLLGRGLLGGVLLHRFSRGLSQCTSIHLRSFPLPQLLFIAHNLSQRSEALAKCKVALAEVEEAQVLEYLLQGVLVLDEEIEQ